MGTSTESGAPVERRRRGRLVVVAIVVVVAVLYGTVVALYAFGGNVTETGTANVPADADAVVSVRPQSVDAGSDRLDVVLDLGLSDRVAPGASGPAAPPRG